MSTLILEYIHHIKRAKLNLEVFILERTLNNPTSKRKFEIYVQRLQWLITDLKTEPNISKDVSDAIDLEFNSDVFTLDEITRKALLLTPDERETVETLLDQVLAGEELNVKYRES